MTHALATGRDLVTVALPRPRTPVADNGSYVKLSGETAAQVPLSVSRQSDAKLRWSLAALLGGGTATDAPDWQDQGLCAETDPEAFFPEKGGSSREAKRVCTGCDVRLQCLQYALDNDERFGIWGGLSERERRRLRRTAR